jgi:hypothetical protein
MDNKSQREIDWAYSIIDPKYHISNVEITEEKHEKAKLRFILHEVCEMISDEYSDTGEYMRMPDGTSTKDIDEFAKERGWDAIRNKMETGYHIGDCTAVPSTCMRCFAEQFYDINTSPENKNDGNRALMIFSKNEKKRLEKAKVSFQKMKNESTSKVNKIGVHLSHCFNDDEDSFGGYNCCKYGEQYCPADPKYRFLLNEILEN